ncbi:OmpA family protein [Argonema galeatum]|uniref:OmpA family protein n=1 Tax=Argonema galeatum TaxID=2942762 RepID=UPI0020112BCC|nr:BON domain-containing protein [Argonema galeatum]MCL1466066.1 OmpA family protein [Argonema galeatum A003/A1]
MSLSKNKIADIDELENLISFSNDRAAKTEPDLESLVNLLYDLRLLEKKEKPQGELILCNDNYQSNDSTTSYEVANGYEYINVSASPVAEAEESPESNPLLEETQAEQPTLDHFTSASNIAESASNSIANRSQESNKLALPLLQETEATAMLEPVLSSTQLTDAEHSIANHEQQESSLAQRYSLEKQARENLAQSNSSEPNDENLEELYGAFKRLQTLLLQPELADFNQVLDHFEQKVSNIEYQIHEPTELINLLLPIISELLNRKVAESSESRDAVADSLAPIIDQVILAKTREDRVAIGSAIAAAIPFAISEQVRNCPTEVGHAIAPDMAAAIKEQIRLNPQAMVAALYPIIHTVIDSKREEDIEALSTAIAPLLPRAIKEQIRSYPQEIAQAIAPEIASAIKEQIRLEQDSIASALAPEMGRAIKQQIEIERDAMVDALYPVIGSTIAKYMADAIKTINEKLENTFSVEGINRKIRSKVQGVSEAELILKEAIPFTVRAVFLIHKTSGLVMSEIQSSGEQKLESDMVAGMLTAIRSFVNDCIAQSGDVSEIDAIDYGNSKIVLEVAGYCYLAVVTQGKTPQWYNHRVQEALLTIVESYDRLIKSYEGDPASIPERVHNILEGLIKIEDTTSKDKKFKFTGLLVVGSVLAGLILLPWGYHQYRNGTDRQIEKDTAQRWASVPELAVYRLSIDAYDGKLRLSGKLPNQELRSKAEQIAKQIAPTYSLKNQIAVQPPPDPVRAASDVKRVTSILNQMNGTAISSQYQAGKVTVKGTVAQVGDAEKITQAFKQIPGIVTVTNTIQLQQFSVPIRIYFELGATQLKAGDRNKVLQVKAFLNRYPQTDLTIVGHSDTIGNSLENQRLALSRAETVRLALVAEGIDPKRLQAVGTPNPPLGLDSSQPLWLSRCVQFQPIPPGFKRK